MLKIEDIKQLISQYGDVKLSDLEKLIKGHNVYKCPKCQGKGYLIEKYNAYPSGLPDSGWVEVIKDRKIDCYLCKGVGYTEKEFKPVIETKILGYK